MCNVNRSTESVTSTSNPLMPVERIKARRRGELTLWLIDLAYEMGRAMPRERFTWACQLAEINRALEDLRGVVDGAIGMTSNAVADAKEARKKATE